FFFYFFFQAEDGIRDFHVTGVQTCALPISGERRRPDHGRRGLPRRGYQLHGPLRPWPDLHAHESGTLRAPETAADGTAQRLGLRHQVQRNGSGFGTKFTVSIEAAEGVSTGISAADRARTVQAAAAPDAVAEDIVSPGHIFPLMAQPGGVLARAGHTEAACDLA